MAIHLGRLLEAHEGWHLGRGSYRLASYTMSPLIFLEVLKEQIVVPFHRWENGGCEAWRDSLRAPEWCNHVSPSGLRQEPVCTISTLKAGELVTETSGNIHWHRSTLTPHRKLIVNSMDYWGGWSWNFQGASSSVPSTDSYLSAGHAGSSPSRVTFCNQQYCLLSLRSFPWLNALWILSPCTEREDPWGDGGK